MNGVDHAGEAVRRLKGHQSARHEMHEMFICPIEDRRRLDSPREGILDGRSLGSHLVLFEYTGRLFREGKAAIPAELAVLVSDGRVDMAVGGQRALAGLGQVNVVGRVRPIDAV
jgi:hypothetical protein